MWHKPNGTTVKQGHCKTHRHMDTCGTHSTKCPACVTEVVMETPVVSEVETNEENKGDENENQE